MESDCLSAEEVVARGEASGDLEVKLSTFQLSVMCMKTFGS